MPDAVFKQILDDTETRIEAIGLADITDANINVHHVADLRPKYSPSLPAVIISPLGDTFRTGLDDGGTNEREAIQYRTLIIIAAAGQHQQGVDLDKHLLWRQEIRRALHYQDCTITGDTFLRSEIEFGPVFDNRAWRDGGGLVLSILFRLVDVREGRSNS